MSFSVIKHIDETIVTDGASEDRATKTPSVWPSEAAAYRTDRRHFKKYGACMRKIFYRMIGWPRAGSIDASGAWKWAVGKAIEDKLTELTKMESKNKENIYVANGVKFFVPDLFISPEMDIITIDPETKKAYIIECKSYDGYFKEKKIEVEGHPSEENLIQICIYLSQVPTGKKLKEIVNKSLKDRAKLDAKAAADPNFQHRNRCEADPKNLEDVDDGPLGARLVYVSRGACNRREFDISIMEDADGKHYPVVDGVPYKIFTIESIYENFREAQQYWIAARREAVRLLELEGIKCPDHLNLILSLDQKPDDQFTEFTTQELKEQDEYLAKLEAKVRSLPDKFFPEPEYEFAYKSDRIEELGEAGYIGKTKYNAWKKGKDTSPIGDWQCRFCDYAAAGCVQKQIPQIAHLLYDISNLPEDAEVEIG